MARPWWAITILIGLYAAYDPAECQSDDAVSVHLIVNNVTVMLDVPANIVPIIPDLALEIITQIGSNATFDINECQTPSINNCTENEMCIDMERTRGLFKCICKSGFIEIAGQCVESPCAAINMTCGVDQKCNINTTTCECAPDFFKVNDTCQILTPCFPNICPAHSVCNEVNSTSYNCTCNGNGGYQKVGGNDDESISCEDIDECSNGSNPCTGRRECRNTDGSYACDCPKGFRENGTECEDIDECDNGSNDCDVNANCTNKEKGFSCTCNQGYTGNGTSCYDIRPCTEPGCSNFATCAFDSGRYECVCNLGFTGDGINCTDIDECGGSGICNGLNCTNSLGSFHCGCSDGYESVGDECLGENGCTKENDCGDRNCYRFEGNNRCYIGTPIGITTSSEVRKTRETADDFGQAIETYLEERLAIDVNVTIVRTIDLDGDSKIHTAIFNAPVEYWDAIEIFLLQLQNETLGGMTVEYVNLPVRANTSFTGIVKTTNASEECKKIVQHVRKDVEFTPDTNITCVINAIFDGNATFTITVHQEDDGTIDLEEILSTYPIIGPGCPCGENAVCNQISGRRFCSCDDSHHDNDFTKPGTDCISPIQNVSCGTTSIATYLYLAYLYRIGLNLDHLHLSNTSCKGFMNGEFLTFETGKDECGWESINNGSHVVYTNKVTNTYKGVHIAEKSLLFSIFCSYPTKFSTIDDEKLTSVNSLTATLIIASAEGKGEIIVTLTLYEDAFYNQVLTNETTKDIGDMIYVQAVHSSTAIPSFLRLDTCWLTPTSDHTDNERLDIITDSCISDDVFARDLVSGSADEASFAMKIIKFPSSSEFFLHCDVALCNADCSSNCDSRKIQQRQSHSDGIVSVGPILNTKASPSSEDPSEEVASGGGSGGVIGAVIAVIAVVAVVGFIIYRRKRNDSTTSFGSTFHGDYHSAAFQNQTVEYSDCPSRISRRNNF